MSAGRLAEELAAHPYEHGACGCSEYVLDMPYADHLAAVVLELLDSDETYAAAEARIARLRLGVSPNLAAQAALAAIRTHLTAPTKEESDD